MLHLSAPLSLVSSDVSGTRDCSISVDSLILVPLHNEGHRAPENAPGSWPERFRISLSQITPMGEASALSKLIAAGCEEKILNGFILIITWPGLDDLPIWSNFKLFQDKSLRLSEKLKVAAIEIGDVNESLGSASSLFDLLPRLLHEYAEMLSTTFSSVGSFKTTTLNYYLVALSLYIEQTTTAFHDGEVASLIDAGSAAHGNLLPEATTPDSIRKKRDYFRDKHPTLFASLLGRIRARRL